MCICNYEAKSDTEAVFCIQGSSTLVNCLKPILKFRIKLYFKYTFYLFSMACIKRFIEMDWQHVRSLIQYGRYDKLVRERFLFLFFFLFFFFCFVFFLGGGGGGGGYLVLSLCRIRFLLYSIENIIMMLINML